MGSKRFPIQFDAWYRLLSSSLLLFPSSSFVEVDENSVRVRMGWGFRSEFPREKIQSVKATDSMVLSRGVHGFGGDWLVNGSSKGMVEVQLSPPQRAWVIGVPVKLKKLLVSLEDAAAFISAIQSPKSVPAT